MKLIECYVSSFGVLKNFRYNFNEGLNVINEINGFGKTTFTVFIKSMFYGLNDTKRGLDENERKKYKPWNSTERFGGYLVFEKNEKKYKIERFFGNKSSEDSAILTELSTGKTFNDYFDLGNKLFEIDEDGFLSTTYFSQKDIKVKSNYTLTAKFNDVCEIEDLSAFDSAVSKIKDKAKTYEYSGGRGLIPQAKNEITETKKQIQLLNQSSQSIDLLYERQKLLKEELENSNAQINALTEELSVAIKVESAKQNKVIYEDFVSKKLAIKNEIDKCDALLNGCEPTQEEILACKDCIDELVRLKEKESLISQHVKELEENCNHNKKSENKKVASIFSLVGGVAFLLSLVVTYFNVILGVILSTVTLFAEIVSLIFQFKKHPADSSIQQLVNSKVEEHKEIVKCISNYESTVNVFFSKFNLPELGFEDKLEIVKDTVKNRTNLLKDLSVCEKNLNDLSDKTDEIQVENVRSSFEIKQLLFQKNNQVNELSSKITQLNSTIKDRESEIRNISVLEAKLEELESRKEEYVQKQNVLSLTAKFLQQADVNLKTKYREPLQNAFEKYLGIVTNGNKKANIDIDFNVKIEEEGCSQDVAYYSKGYRDVFDICKRFALVEVLFSKEKPFIILDDPFCNLDEVKLKESLEMIESLSKTHQILYLVCHSSRTVNNG